MYVPEKRNILIVGICRSGNIMTVQLYENNWGQMQFLNLRMQQIEWRRCQVMELSSKGYNQTKVFGIFSKKLVRLIKNI